ncbi:EF-hand domain-containing protein [Sphingosinicella sp. LHD-64]|uniref:EF-hand domain-containing protein n=1 Tax=Sphingosinicella sp. LHD-64 TaxID=3072139 RepID=UPI0028100993|nr:EF-hand domain-containing protein [Sphingosinicella sp. LHD-64]MDQ8754903.1 EF-hand domain-containing protein [Sphingosinicella sp. LHD-64]
MKTRALIAGAALTVAIAGAAWAQTSETPRPDRNADMTRQQVIERVDQRFARLDADRDGRFTREEAQQRHAQRQTERANRMFDRLDLDRNGSITREEMSQAQAQRFERRDARRAERAEAGEHRRHRGLGRRGGHHRFAMGGERMFGEQGFITVEQMRERALARFDRMDADRNGTVTAAERQQMRAQFRQRMQERRDRAQ